MKTIAELVFIKKGLFFCLKKATYSKLHEQPWGPAVATA